MRRKTKQNQVDQSIVIYYSQEDDCWIAHSIATDQIGTGERVVDALADLIQALETLKQLVKDDPSIACYRRAPDSVIDRLKNAQKLPRETYEVAHRKVHGTWPQELVVDVLPDMPGKPVFSTEPELITD